MLSCVLIMLILISGCVSDSDQITGELTATDNISVENHTIPEEQEEPKPLYPEAIMVTVRDIIDGDTIDIGLEVIDVATEEAITLPEFGSTGHVRIRLLGINAPEKSPKGEIRCSDVEIYKVKKVYADESRDALLPLDDKDVLLYLDPDDPTDTHGRLLALVEYDGENICLRQIMDGLACAYYRDENKYVDKELYTIETMKAKEDGVGMWEPVKYLEERSNVCVENWECSEWGECKAGLQARSCTEENRCGSDKNKPPEVRNCEITEEPSEQTQQEPQNGEPIEGDVIINEIMYDPVNDSYGEWIELYNPSSQPIDLSGWVLCEKALLPGYIDEKTDELKSDSGTMLAPYSYAIITDGGSGTIAYYNGIDSGSLALHTDASTICGGLSNKGDTVILESPDGRTESVTYSEDSAEDGYSLERTASDWSDSLIEGGTPGYENSN